MEIKRRTRAKQVFPSPESFVRLAGAVLANHKRRGIEVTNFMDVKGLAEGYESEPLPPLAGDAEMRLLRLVEEAFVDKLGEATQDDGALKRPGGRLHHFSRRNCVNRN